MAAKELTKAELEAALQAKDAELTAKDEQLAAKDEQLAEKDRVIADQEDFITTLNDQVNESVQLLAEQNDRLSKEDTVTEAVIVTVNKKKYRVAMPSFIHAGETVTAAELKDNKALAEHLVGIGSGILVAL